MRENILVIDDNLINLKLACTILESEDFKVEKATSAEEALRMLKINIPDLILLDIGMPDMDGFTLTKKIKSDEKTKNLLVVALTASAMKGDDVKAFNAGFDGYLIKPIDTRKFPIQVREFLNKQKQI